MQESVSVSVSTFSTVMIDVPNNREECSGNRMVVVVVVVVEVGKREY